MKLFWARISLGTRVGIGFLLIMALLTVFVIIGMIQLSSIKQRVDQLVDSDAIKVSLVHEIMDSVNERIVSMHVLSLMEDPFEQDEEYLRLSALGARFIDARTKLLAMPLSAEDRQVLELARQLAAENRPLLMQVIDAATSGRGKEALDLIHHKVAPIQRKIIQIFNEFLQIQQAAAQQTKKETDKAYHKAQWLMSGLASLVGLLGLLITLTVVRFTNRQAAMLQYKALYDSLTGLPNRTLFADRLQQTVLVYRRQKKSFGLIAMDLNLFKEINDTLGHHVGDEVLKEVSRVVHQSLRESDTVARMGGDEFSFLLPSAQTIEGTVIVAERILKILQEPLKILGQEIEIGASLGIAQYPEHAEQLDDLQRLADMAMYHAKRTRSGHATYSLELEGKSDYDLELRTALRKAITHGDLLLYYQPKIDFCSRCVSGVEALVRWKHPTLGMLQPDRFIPLAETSDLMRPLAEYVLRMAVKQAVAWLDSGLRLSISVNISVFNVQDAQFAVLVKKVLEAHGLPAELLEIEMTEAAVLADPDLGVKCIRALHEIGVVVSIDDFGAGYTLMSQLEELLVAKISIDRSFIKNMVVNRSDAVIVRSAVDLSHSLGFKVVAEGVENQETWDQLEKLGCDSAQGFHMGVPLAPEAFEEWLVSSPWGSADGNTAEKAG